MTIDSTLKTLIKYRLKQLFNRLSVRKNKSKENSSKRSATARKSEGKTITIIFSIFFLITMLFQAENLISKTLNFVATNFSETLPTVELSVSEYIKKIESSKGTSKITNPPSIAKSLTTPLAKTLTLELFLLFLYVFLNNIAISKLGDTKWDLEWLVTMPVSISKLMKMRVLERAIVNPVIIFLIWPFIIVYLFEIGLGMISIPLSILIAFIFSYVESLIRTIIDTGLQMVISIHKLKNIQAIISLLSLFPLWIVIFACTQDKPFLFTLSISPYLDWLIWTPIGLLIGTFTSSSTAELLTSILILGLEVLLIYFLSFKLLKYLLRQGVVDGGSKDGSKRIVVIKRQLVANKKSLLTPIQKREFKLLIRDRNFLVQSLILPIVMIGAQFFSSRINWGDVFKNNFSHLATAAFGLAAYSFISSLFNLLNHEGKALWLIYTFPKSIEKILMEKVYLWLFISLICPIIIISTGLYFNPNAITINSTILILIVLFGVIIYGIIAASFGVFISNPLIENTEKKQRLDYIYLYLILAGFYSYTIYAEDYWTKIILLILSTLMALALLQKAKDHLPYLLDPTESPKSRVSLSDGLIAAQFFFVLQSLITLCFYAALPEQITLTQLISFALAGFFVFIALIIIYYRNRTIGIPKVFGRNIFKATIHGISGGLYAAVVAIVYLLVINHFNFFSETLAKINAESSKQSIVVLSVLMLVAAPLFEEFLFRGIIFNGALRTWPLHIAVIISSSIFAIMHPAISVIPVFCLAVFAALSYAKTKLLITPIIVHAIYNLAVLFFNHFLF